MRRHFVIDTSAIIPFFFTPTGEEEKAKRAIIKLLKLRDEGKVDLRIPNVCMAECSKAIAKIVFASSKDHGKCCEQYRKVVNILLDTVSKKRRGLITSLAMKRKHLEDIEDIFIEEYRIPNRGERRLSGVDALVIAMARDLAKTHGRENVLIVTKEETMARVCNQNRDLFSRAIHVLREPIPDA